MKDTHNLVEWSIEVRFLIKIQVEGNSWSNHEDKDLDPDEGHILKEAVSEHKYSFDYS